MENEEQWKDIPGYEGYYQAGNFGNIRSVSRIKMAFGKNPVAMIGRILRPKPNKNNGYLMVVLSADGKKKTSTVHRLVALSWHENPLGLGDVNHKNGDKHDNSSGNLEWCSRSENIVHAYSSGLRISVRGERVWTNKLSEEQVREIFHAPGPCREIGNRYGVKKACVAAIKSRRAWKHLAMDIIIHENNY